MAYITDAAREYAKKMVKDDDKYAIITKDEEDMFNELLGRYDFEADIMNDDNTRMIVFGDKNEHLQDVIDSINAFGHGFIMSKFKDGNVVNGKQQVFCEVRKLANHDNDESIDYDLFKSSVELKKIKQTLRKIFTERNKTFLSIIELYEKIEQLADNYNKEYSEEYINKFIDQYALPTGPGFYDELSPDFIYEITHNGPISSLKKEYEKDVDKQVDEFMKAYQIN